MPAIAANSFGERNSHFFAKGLALALFLKEGIDMDRFRAPERGFPEKAGTTWSSLSPRFHLMRALFFRFLFVRAD